MTIVINYVSELISIIATDTRVTYGHNTGKWDDNNEKLFNLPLFGMGWSAGVGLGNFLNHFKKELAINEINNPKEIEKIFIDSINKLKLQMPYFSNEIDKSTIVFSWIASNNNTIFPRIGLMTKSHYDNELRILNNNSLYILYPIEYADEKKVQELENRINLKHEFDGIETILKKIFEIFDEISSPSNVNSVSRVCDLGMQFINQEGIYKVRIKDDIQILINELKNNNIFSKFEFCTFY